jgi:cyanate lyase
MRINIKLIDFCREYQLQHEQEILEVYDSETYKATISSVIPVPHIVYKIYTIYILFSGSLFFRSFLRIQI